ncbi:MAG: DUF2924 domain-containing protein [Deltaproteobacteria bacterium]|nr:DUF2924 domain-containing protein [Deltaproteobacteria bacterium]
MKKKGSKSKKKATEKKGGPASPPKEVACASAARRLPAPGSVLRREHEGVVHRVKVLERGFVCQRSALRTCSRAKSACSVVEAFELVEALVRVGEVGEGERFLERVELLADGAELRLVRAPLTRAERAH